MATPYISHRS
jgi:hypothetical protein